MTVVKGTVYYGTQGKVHTSYNNCVKCLRNGSELLNSANSTEENARQIEPNCTGNDINHWMEEINTDMWCTIHQSNDKDLFRCYIKSNEIQSEFNNLLYLKISILDLKPLWEWMWCHCIFYVRQVWNMHTIHRYRPEIPEPAPSLFRHGAQIGGIWGFPAIKITMICQVHMYCSLGVKIDMPKTLYSVQRLWTHFVCVCFRTCGQQKPEYPHGSIAPWLRTPLHRAV